MSWPREVPILEPEDIIKGKMHSDDNKSHCLIGWNVHVFGPWNNVNVTDVENRIIKKIGTAYISTWNDGRATSKEEIADVWNSVMHDLGYTEVTNA